MHHTLPNDNRNMSDDHHCNQHMHKKLLPKSIKLFIYENLYDVLLWEAMYKIYTYGEQNIVLVLVPHVDSDK